MWKEIAWVPSQQSDVLQLLAVKRPAWNLGFTILLDEPDLADYGEELHSPTIFTDIDVDAETGIQFRRKATILHADSDQRESELRPIGWVGADGWHEGL